MSQRLQIVEACLYLTDLLCDRTKPWEDRFIYFKEWLQLIYMWKRLDNNEPI